MATDTRSDEQATIQFHFATLAGQYYEAGKFAFANNHVPVAGNLLHHAVENFLKCALAPFVSLSEFKKTYSHHLDKLWQRFVDQFKSDTAFPNDRLVEFAEAIRQLNRFEKIRYPDNMLRGYEVSYATSTGGGVWPATTYRLVLSLVKQIIDLAIHYSGIDAGCFGSAAI